jgi:hypothetical protein
VKQPVTKQIQAKPTPVVFEDKTGGVTNVQMNIPGGAAPIEISWSVHQVCDTFDMQFCTFPASDATVLTSGSQPYHAVFDNGTVAASGNQNTYQARVRAVKGGVHAPWVLSQPVFGIPI